jgi:hypothetical protein
MTSDKDPVPNPWDVLNDYSKTVITLSSGLLVITVTFLDRLLKTKIDPGLALLVILVWGCLILSIIAGLLAAAFTINFLKNNTRDHHAILMANAAFFLLVLAGIFLVWVGIKQLAISGSEMNIDAAVKLAEKSLDVVTNDPNPDWMVTSLDIDSSQGMYKLHIKENAAGDEYLVIVNTSSKDVKKIELIATPSP